jgi:hypothetical protein
VKVENGYLYIGFHEFAWSVRTSGFPCYFLNSSGKVVGKFHAEKRAMRVQIPEGSKYLFRKYWTNSGYPDHTLYLLKEGEPEIAAEIDKTGLTYQKEVEPEVQNYLEQNMYDC